MGFLLYKKRKNVMDNQNQNINPNQKSQNY